MSGYVVSEYRQAIPHTSSVAGNAATKLISTALQRVAVSITNFSTTRSLLIVEQSPGSAPTVSTSTATKVIAPYSNMVLPLGEKIDLYAQFDDASSSTDKVCAVEYLG